MEMMTAPTLIVTAESLIFTPDASVLVYEARPVGDRQLGRRPQGTE